MNEPIEELVTFKIRESDRDWAAAEQKRLKRTTRVKPSQADFFERLRAVYESREADSPAMRNDRLLSLGLSDQDADDLRSIAILFRDNLSGVHFTAFRSVMRLAIEELERVRHEHRAEQHKAQEPELPESKWNTINDLIGFLTHADETKQEIVLNQIATWKRERDKQDNSTIAMKSKTDAAKEIPERSPHPKRKAV